MNPDEGATPGLSSERLADGIVSGRLVTRTASAASKFQMPRSVATSRSHPFGDALHHHALDPEITVWRHPFAWIGASGDLAVRYHYQLFAR